MKRYFRLVVFVLFVFLYMPSFASPPTSMTICSIRWENGGKSSSGIIPGRLLSDFPNLSYNSPTQIVNELRDERLIGKLARAALMKPDEFGKIDISFGQDGFAIRGDLKSEAQFQNVVNVAKDYIEQRLSGHTKEYLIDSLEAKVAKAETSDHTLGMLLRRYPELPPSWLKKTADWTTTDTARSPVRYIVYTLIDGEVAWDYTVTILSDGSQGGVGCENMDAKDRDPKYVKIMKEVNAKVKARMKKGNVQGLGSCLVFWEWKKDSLRGKGIEWRSPKDLNPHTFYD